MKKAFIAFLTLTMLLIGTAYADDIDIAKLKMEITNKINKPYAFCVDDMCYPLVRNGQLIPIEVEKVESIIMTDMTNGEMYSEAIPASCHVDVAKNEVLVVTGALVSKGNAVALNHLSCSLRSL